MASQTRRMVFVDGLRGLAALCIVLPHAWEFFLVPIRHPGWQYNLVFDMRLYGTVSVQIFFVLSGFVIAYSLRDADLTAASFGRFLLRRSIRLDPPYWVSIVLYCSAHVAIAGTGHRFAALPSTRVLAAHLFYLQDILGYGEPIGHIFWTLCIEIQMYVVFAASIGLLQKMRLPYRPVLTLAAVLCLGWPLGFFPCPILRFFPASEYCFLAGSVAWWWTERSIPRWMLFTVVGCFFAASFTHNDFQLWGTCLAMMLLVVAGSLGTLYTWLGSRPLQFLGAVSYSVYLVHEPVVALIGPVQRRLGFTSTGNAVLVLLLTYLISLTVAYAIHRWVEVPSIRLSHKLKPPARSKPPVDFSFDLRR